MSIHVTVWNEGRHERGSEEIRKVYPDGIHGAIKNLLSTDEELIVTTATLDDPDCGLPDEVLNNTDVLIWWGHMAHQHVPDAVAKRVQNRVLCGMGAIFLHSAHLSKPFTLLMGTSCTLRWRDDARERVWCVNPAHPIAKGVPEQFLLEHEEMYGERFDVPNPDDVVFIGWFNGGEVFRSGLCYQRGRGRVFYFQPGHEEYPRFHEPIIGQIIRNAVHWAAPNEIIEYPDCPNPDPLEN